MGAASKQGITGLLDNQGNHWGAGMHRKCVRLVQQGVWAMPLESMPLAMGYLKAAVDTDEVLRGECETTIVNLRGATPVGTAMSAVFAHAVPAVSTISVFGWN